MKILKYVLVLSHERQSSKSSKLVLILTILATFHSSMTHGLGAKIQEYENEKDDWTDRTDKMITSLTADLQDRERMTSSEPLRTWEKDSSQGADDASISNPSFVAHPRQSFDHPFIPWMRRSSELLDAIGNSRNEHGNEYAILGKGSPHIQSRSTRADSMYDGSFLRFGRSPAPFGFPSPSLRNPSLANSLFYLLRRSPGGAGEATRMDNPMDGVHLIFHPDSPLMDRITRNTDFIRFG